MSFDGMIATGMAVFKQKLEEFFRAESEKPLSPEVAHAIASGITEAATGASRAVFEAFLESRDVRSPDVVVGDETFRFKCLSEKTFLSFWGPVTLYGAVHEGEKTPERLSTRYVARMREENAVGFKSQLEAEVAAVLQRLPPEIPRVFLCDAARSIWKYRFAGKTASWL